MAEEKNVLISFLGTGDRNGNYSDYVYEIEGKKQESTTTLIFKALFEHYKEEYGKIDNIILLGTLTSMWQNVYISFDGDDDYIDNELQTLIENENYLTSISSKPNCIEEVQKVVRKQTEACVNIELLNYGCNQEQIKGNAQVIMGLDKYFNDSQTKYNLIVDVTHGFRSLPLYVMNLLIYLQNVKANIEIKHITYGMSDLTKDYKWKKDKGDKICPVVDLNDPEYGIMALNKWINGAYAFKEFGKGYQIAELLKTNVVNKINDLLKKNEDNNDVVNRIRDLMKKNEGNNDTIKVIKNLLKEDKTNNYTVEEIKNLLKVDNVNNDPINKINDFSDVMNLNSMSNIDTKTELLLSIQYKDVNPFANQVLTPVISQFSVKNKEGKIVNKFNGNNSKSLLSLTIWHFDHKNFASSFLTILECIILFVQEKCSFCKYILTKEKYLLKKEDKINYQWNNTIQYIKDTKKQKVYANKSEYIDEQYQDYVNNQNDKCAKQVLGNEEISIIDENDISNYTTKIDNYDDMSLVYKSVNHIRNSIAHVNKYDSKSLIYKYTQLLDKLPGVSIIETNLIEIKILDASIKLLKKIMK